MTESSGYLLDELFLDINAHFSDILTSKWQNSTDAIDTVCETLQASFTYRMHESVSKLQVHAT